MRNKMLNNAAYGKYSCSLPREIPALLHNLNRKKDYNGADKSNQKNINDENRLLDDDDIFENKFLENQDEDEQDDVYDDDDDDDDNGDNESKTKNMGQAISDLASSIVEKDGRELFGGVPSRRVPINSISQSFF